MWLACAGPSMAQLAIPGNANLVTAPSPPDGFQIDSSVTCPTPSIGAGGFIGDASGWGERRPEYDLTRGGNTNYGLAVLAKFPLGGSLGAYCREYAKKKLENTQLINEVNLRNSQLSLLAACEWTQRMNFKHLKELVKDSRFSSLAACADNIDKLDRTLDSNEGMTLSPTPGSSATKTTPVPAQRPKSESPPVQAPIQPTSENGLTIQRSPFR